MEFNERDGYKLNSKERTLFQELVRRKVPFILAGLSAATIRGAPLVTQDMDLWFKKLSDPRLHEAIRAAGGTFVTSWVMNPPRIVGEGLHLIDLMLNPQGLDSFEKEYKRCETLKIEGIPIKVLPIERLIKSKQTAGRDKDKMAIPVLKDFLKVLKARKQLRKKKKP